MGRGPPYTYAACKHYEWPMHDAMQMDAFCPWVLSTRKQYRPLTCSSAAGCPRLCSYRRMELLRRDVYVPGAGPGGRNAGFAQWPAVGGGDWARPAGGLPRRCVAGSMGGRARGLASTERAGMSGHVTALCAGGCPAWGAPGRMLSMHAWARHPYAKRAIGLACTCSMLPYHTANMQAPCAALCCPTPPVPRWPLECRQRVQCWRVA